MKNNLPVSPPNFPVSKTGRQPNPFVLALALTTLLYLSAQKSVPTTHSALAVKLPSNQPTISMLTPALKKAVLEEVALRQQLPASRLKIVYASPQTSQNQCLERQQICPQAVVTGWEVVVANDVERWVYRTNEAGAVVEPER